MIIKQNEILATLIIANYLSNNYLNNYLLMLLCCRWSADHCVTLDGTTMEVTFSTRTLYTPSILRQALLLQ